MARRSNNGQPSLRLPRVIRLTTHRQIPTSALPVQVACSHARAWLARPCVAILHPGDRHAAVFFGLLEYLGSAGSLTTDAHLAAL